MGISRTHAARMNLDQDLKRVTQITFPVFLHVGNHDYLEPVAPVGTISVGSSHEAFSELAQLLRAVADEIDPNVRTVIRGDTETVTHGRSVENVDLFGVRAQEASEESGLSQ